MIVLPLPTFADLHEIGVQIEDAMMQGLINQDREQRKKAFTRSLNAGTSSAAAARTSDVGMVTTTTPKTATATPSPVNFIQRTAIPYDPSIYITPSYLPKPEVFIPDNTDLCILSISQTQPELVVVIVEDRTGMTLEADGNVGSELEGSGSFAYNPSGYITSTYQAKPRVELPVGAEISVVREDRPSQGLDDLGELEEDIVNLQFFNEQDSGDVNINWFDLDGSVENTGWLSDEPDVVEAPQPEQGQLEAGISAVAGMAEN
ncbi:hypothetical protein HYC85_029243 [Camellia sinensis]|uniref:Uncharacterized protein n=1 Tax=Camellia sinensis TaxID=4442 RepID=A0A7J7FXI8_CAMSI|nr:hypothetical protein HYC85_029243 [Camellia sinensis]